MNGNAVIPTTVAQAIATDTATPSAFARFAKISIFR